MPSRRQFMSYGPGNIVIDSCRQCRLVWLDCREMSAIELAPGTR